MSENRFSGKAKSGLFAGGQGPVWGQTISGSNGAKLPDNLGSGKHPKTVSGGPTPPRPVGSEEKGFDINGKSYRGPQNFIPENKGESSNQPTGK